MIKYIGSKRSLLSWISDLVERVSARSVVRVVADPFSGSARVSHALKARGFYVISGDVNHYAYVLAKALVEADAREYPKEKVDPLLQKLSLLPPKRGWFTRTYCEEARYFQPKNGARIEAIREAIEGYSHDPTLKAILLTSLMLAADRVDSTTGVQMAYLKRWAPRSYHDLELRYPPLLPGKGEAHLADALDFVGNVEADLFYLDPPYNSHSYLGNYHLWETLVLWDQPETYGVAKKRADVKFRKSPFNSKRSARRAMEDLISKIRSKHVLLSFNDEGFFTPSEIEAMLGQWGYVLSISRPHRRYIGSVIGVYNPKGEKVGKVSHTRNNEFLFLATQSKEVFEGLKGLGGWIGGDEGVA